MEINFDWISNQHKLFVRFDKLWLKIPGIPQSQESLFRNRSQGKVNVF